MTTKNELFEKIEAQKEKLWEMADFIFDHPEYRGKEYQACDLLTKYLTDNGFSVERSVGGYETSFRAEWKHGEGGPVIGILCEYDALEGLGHGCGHHMQGPSCLGAAVALKECAGEEPFTLVVYGTPAEETLGSKCDMIKNGCFHELDAAFMMHGSPTTCTDVKCLADQSFRVTFHGKRAHAALAPEQGRSAFDALLVAFNGIEFLREHVPDDVRMHYTVAELPGPANVVPVKSVGKFSLRSFSKEELKGVVSRFKDIIKGAALIAGVDYELEQTSDFYNKIPVLKLNELLMENAKLAGAPRLAPPREKTGSTDFGNVMYEIPGSCIRVAFVPEGTSSHSQEFVDAGKTQAARDCILYGAKSIAGASMDLITKPELMDEADWYTVDVITCAAPNLREKPSNAFNTGDGKDSIKITDKELLAIHEKRLRRILDVALSNKVETIVLGAFGCGAFMNNPNVVAQASKNVLNEYLYAFKNIEFAVYCSPSDDTNYRIFDRVFRPYTK